MLPLWEQTSSVGLSEVLGHVELTTNRAAHALGAELSPFFGEEGAVPYSVLQRSHWDFTVTRLSRLQPLQQSFISAPLIPIQLLKEVRRTQPASVVWGVPGLVASELGSLAAGNS